MIEENARKFLSEISGGNCYGEKVTLVAATKTRTAEEINRAIAAGITDIGENKVQEFRDKFDFIHGGNRHFIGHLQTNKVKYLIGKTYLYHSIDRDELAAEIAKRSTAAGITSDILIQINIGCEESKGGYPLEAGFEVYTRLKQTEGLHVKGFMAMLPISNDEKYLAGLCKQMRALYEKAKAEDENVCYLSMGMSGDWKLCLENGSNMIRLGTAIFGERNYGASV
ncbi:MAG: YggS family pyridoxal phosphate-dependent enzyme [Clostridia bacterium]|nr:YggS family pyridoxal phosphate-dependent enzyme [Clostridia bacterium]